MPEGPPTAPIFSGGGRGGVVSVSQKPEHYYWHCPVFSHASLSSLLATIYTLCINTVRIIIENIIVSDFISAVSLTRDSVTDTPHSIYASADLLT